jgi:signal peptidase II
MVFQANNTTIRRLLRAVVILLILTLNISCDQLSKSIVREKIGYNESIQLLDHYLTLTRVENTGAFLSIGNTLRYPFNLILLSIFPIIMLGGAFWYLMKKQDLSNLMILGVCLIMGGGAGNIYDRIMHGSVTDFLHMDLLIFQTGIFNVADISIMTGIFLIFTEFYIRKNRVKPAQGIQKKSE